MHWYSNYAMHIPMNVATNEGFTCSVDIVPVFCNLINVKHWSYRAAAVGVDLLNHCVHWDQLRLTPTLHVGVEQTSLLGILWYLLTTVTSMWSTGTIHINYKIGDHSLLFSPSDFRLSTAGIDMNRLINKSICITN